MRKHNNRFEYTNVIFINRDITWHIITVRGHDLMLQHNLTTRLLSYSELMLILQGLCREKQSGVMVINGESGTAAQLILEQGLIFDANCAGISGKAALSLIKSIKQGKASFFKRAQKKAINSINLSTAEILYTLINSTQTVETITPPITTAQESQTHGVIEEQLMTIEMQLAIIIGPIARLIYADYQAEIQQANDLSVLGIVIEKIAKQTLIGEQQTTFKYNIRELIHRCALKQGQHAILGVLKSTSRELSINPITLSLCISKHAVQGEIHSELLNKLANQIECAGNLAGIVNLLDILKFLEKSTKTGFLAIELKRQKAGFYFEQGKLINAIEGNKRGRAIALDILQWQPDSITFSSLAQIDIARDIYHPVGMLINSLYDRGLINPQETLKFTKTTLSASELQDALAREIERLQHKKAGGQETERTEAKYIGLIARAIHLVNSYDDTNAEQLLCDALQHYDNNYNAWLWLARISHNMTVIEFALKKAAYLHPKSSELANKIKKFTLARNEIHSDFVLRCPFCWAPTKEKNNECHYCQASFFMDAGFFSRMGKAKADIIDKAIARYDDALQRDTANLNNVYLYFYLAMAYLNRQYYQEALAQLNEITKIAPENRTLIRQHSLLASYMQSVGLMATPVQTTAKNSNLSRGKVLVVEDSMVTRKVIARTLTENNYQVFEAKDAEHALTQIEIHTPDLVLLDIILPKKDGYQILAEIRQKPHLAKIPVIMLTSRDSLFDKLKGKVSDANEYLTKPFRPDELLLVVKKYLK